MSTYSNRLQPALQNLLQHVVQFFHPRSSCMTTHIGRRSENNIKCVVHDDLGWKNQTTRYMLPHHWLYEWFSQFHSCGTYSVLHGAIQLCMWVCVYVYIQWHSQWCMLSAHQSLRPCRDRLADSWRIYREWWREYSATINDKWSSCASALETGIRQVFNELL